MASNLSLSQQAREIIKHVNPSNTDLFNLNFKSLEVVSRYHDTQLQVTKNVRYLVNLSLNIYQYFKIEGIYYCEQARYQGLDRC